MQVYVMVTWSRGQVRVIGFQIHFNGPGSRMYVCVCGGGDSQRDVQGASKVQPEHRTPGA